MAKIALDIVLLPPEQVIDSAIVVNRRLLIRQPSVLKLGKTQRLPHITLMQAVLEERDLGKAQGKLKRIAAMYKPIQLSAELSAEKDTWSFYRIKGPPVLYKLHEVITDDFQEIVTYDARPKYFDDAEIRPQAVEIVRNFRTESSHSNFAPHITLGLGSLSGAEEHFSFVADRLAMCHLGDYNTCKKLLYEVSLKT